MINEAWANDVLPSSWKEGLVKLFPKRDLREVLSDWRQLLTKMLASRIKGFLHDGLHPAQYGFVPRRQINDNLANAYIAIEYAKYTNP